MSFKNDVAKATGIKKELIPGSYQGIGHIMLMKFMNANDEQKKLIAEAALGLYKNFKVVCEIKNVDGELRQPIMIVIRAEKGYGTETIHKENGILYKLDVAKVMFSKGNLTERKRLLPSIKKYETVVDMFAGIGYFTLGLARQCEKVYAIEKNKDAYYYLCENIELNKLQNVKTFLGDCRIVADQLRGVADHVLMGYFPNTENYLPAALLMAKKKSVIHYHDLAKFDNAHGWSDVVNKIEPIISEAGYKVMKIDKKKVKSYSPRTWHVVMDITITKE